VPCRAVLLHFGAVVLCCAELLHCVAVLRCAAVQLYRYSDVFFQVGSGEITIEEATAMLASAETDAAARDLRSLANSLGLLPVSCHCYCCTSPGWVARALN
jgi:hypothetical protein